MAAITAAMVNELRAKTVQTAQILMAAGIAWLILRISLRRPAPQPAFRPTTPA